MKKPKRSSTFVMDRGYDDNKDSISSAVCENSSKGESYRLKDLKEFMRQKQQSVNPFFEQGNV